MPTSHRTSILGIRFDSEGKHNCFRKRKARSRKNDNGVVRYETYQNIHKQCSTWVCWRTGNALPLYPDRCIVGEVLRAVHFRGGSGKWVPDKPCVSERGWNVRHLSGIVWQFIWVWRWRRDISDRTWIWFGCKVTQKSADFHKKHKRRQTSS